MIATIANVHLWFEFDNKPNRMFTFSALHLRENIRLSSDKNERQRTFFVRSGIIFQIVGMNPIVTAADLTKLVIGVIENEFSSANERTNGNEKKFVADVNEIHLGSNDTGSNVKRYFDLNKLSRWGISKRDGGPNGQAMPNNANERWSSSVCAGFCP